MSALPAYDYADRAYERERYAQPDISVVPGRGRKPETRTLSPSVVTIAKIAAVVVVVAALLCFVRISLSAATVSTALEAKQLTSSIEQARTDGGALEVAQSTLANPTRIKDAAAAMGMAVPEETVKFDLSGDVVVTDGAGNLSLSGSIAVAAAN